MKKMYRILFAVAAAATAFIGCVREPEMLPAAKEHAIHFVAESIETRTAFGEPTGNAYPTLWTENDQSVKVWLHLKSGKDAAVTPSSDGQSASFTATFADTTIGYKFFALSPLSAYVSHDEYLKIDGTQVLKYRLGVNVPTSQTPTATSVDEAAQILLAQTDLMQTIPETVSFQFHHWTAYGKFSLSNLALNGATIEAVDLTSEVDWAGRWHYYFVDGTTAVNSGSKTISVNTTSSSDIWFACAPVDMSGKKLTVTVKTDKGTLTKEFTMPANRKFESGQVARFTLNMSGATFSDSEVYELITDAADLTVNSKVIIAAASDAFNYAISTTQNTSNRAAAAVTKADGKIVDPAAGVEIFTVEAGAESGTYSFKGLNSKYINAPGGGNKLTSKASKDSSSSWTVTFHESYVVIESITKKEQRFLRFNLNKDNGSPLFGCYKVDATIRDSVALYKLVGSGGEEPPVEKKETGLWLTEKTYTINVNESIEFLDEEKFDEGYYDDGGVLTFSSSDASVAYVDEMMIVGLKAGTCTITVTAPETEHYNAAEKTCTVTVNDPANAKTISELLDMAEGLLDKTSNTVIAESVEMNQATVMATDGGNIVAKDATGIILVYKGNSNLSVGDVITAVGELKNYYGVAEVNATTVTKVSSGATVDYGAPITFDETAITAYQSGSSRAVQFVKYTGYLPVSKSSAYVNVGEQRVRIYNTASLEDADLGKKADVMAYTIGYHSQGYLQTLTTSYTVDASAPFLLVDVTSKTWAADETDPCTVNVSVETGGSWSYTATDMDWATITKSGNTLVVTPKAANSAATPNEGSVVLKNTANESRTASIEFKQSGVVTGSSFVLDSDAIAAAHSSSWAYTSGSKTITATDGSDWICYNTFANKNQVTVQMRPASNSTITTPTVPSGKKITHLAVSCSWNNDGTGGFESTRTLQIMDGNETVVSSITCKDLYEGVDIPGNHTKLTFGPTASGSGTIYVLNATVTFN